MRDDGLVRISRMEVNAVDTVETAQNPPSVQSVKPHLRESEDDVEISPHHRWTLMSNFPCIERVTHRHRILEVGCL